MWLETIAALSFVLGLWHIWFLGAVGWGLLSGAMSLLSAVAAIANGGVGGEELLASLASVIFDSASAAWSVPAWAWSWAKFEHPWIATALGFIGFAFQGAIGDDR